MVRAFTHRIHGAEEPIHRTVESALWAAGFLIATLLAILILLLGVFVTRAI
jgi:hypothetical protein